jgi:hypothetical protein
MRLPDFIFLRRPGARILSALILALIVGGVVVLARLFGQATQGSTPDVADASPDRSVSTTAGDDSVYASNSASADAVPSAAIRVGENFVRAWLQPTDGRTQASWYAGLEKYASPDLAAEMRAVDPSTNPATKVTGAAVGTVITPDSAKIVVPTNAGPATTLCVRATAGWQVATIDLGQ